MLGVRSYECARHYKRLINKRLHKDYANFEESKKINKSSMLGEISTAASVDQNPQFGGSKPVASVDQNPQFGGSKPASVDQNPQPVGNLST